MSAFAEEEARILGKIISSDEINGETKIESEEGGEEEETNDGRFDSSAFREKLRWAKQW